MNYEFILVLAIILLSTKVLGIASRKVQMPAVVGALTAGILLGPSGFKMVESSLFIEQTAEIGVILLMFLAGLDTDIEDVKKNGTASVFVAIMGVIMPLIGGFLVYRYFFGITPGNKLEFLKAVFIGVILTATSVSITVETLREMGKLKGKIGTTILGAAILDDIIGIIILTCITSFTKAGSDSGSVFIKIAAYFVFLSVVWLVSNKIFKITYKSVGEKRRIAIYGLSMCMILSYCSEHFFGIADITGAYFAGIMLCNFGFKEYIVKKINITSYMIFSPIFFASIGIKTELAGFTPRMYVFTAVLLLVAVVSKMAGCGIAARVFRFPKVEALAVGIGMVSRGEVALIVAQKGSSSGLLDNALFPSVVAVVIITTLITPVLLKIAMKDKISDSDKNYLDTAA